MSIRSEENTNQLRPPLILMNQMECNKLYRVVSSVIDFNGAIVLRINPEIVLNLSTIRDRNYWDKLKTNTLRVEPLQIGESITLIQE